MTYDELGGRMELAARVTPHGLIREGEVTSVSVCFEECDRFCDRTGGFHPIRLRLPRT